MSRPTESGRSSWAATQTKPPHKNPLHAFTCASPTDHRHRFGQVKAHRGDEAGEKAGLDRFYLLRRTSVDTARPGRLEALRVLADPTQQDHARSVDREDRREPDRIVRGPGRSTRHRIDSPARTRG